MDILEYKGYHGTAELDMSRGVCRGKILHIPDLVTYESATPARLRDEFQAAVDDYLETCEALGRKPRKPASGTFNVRTTPELHRQAQVRACIDGTSMNDVVSRALSEYLSPKREIHERHTEKHFLVISDGEQGTLHVPMSVGNESEVGRVLQ